MTPVVRLAPGSQWDQVLLNDLLSGELWAHGLQFERLDSYPREAEGICLVVPGRYYAEHAAEISEAIAKYRWVLGFRVGDEEDLFDVSAVRHPAIRWWVQTPRTDRDYGTARFLPLGYTPHFSHSPADPPAKPLDAVLVGQCTHDRRAQAFDALARVARPKYVQATHGFTRGLPPAEYAHLMLQAKVAPCPSGPASPDTFRVYEALQAHAIPVLDDITPGYDSRGYWERMLSGCPAPILTDYDDLPGYIEDALVDYPRLANRIIAWWIAQKRSLAIALREDLQALGAV
ncbi:hypothetical protein [Nocardia sp. NPDC049149]|uniref:hypothetical protein n=1 Tax=Nocardia sp. NPDC049149 TaxID=3364315 RepID=UPI0037205C5D